MAEPLETADLAGHTGPGCVHAKLTAIRAALVAWRNAAGNAAAFADLKSRLETACPGVTWTQAKILRALRRWAEET